MTTYHRAAYTLAPLSADINKTLSNTFIAVGAMWLITALASAVSLELQLGLWANIGLLVASLALIFGVHSFRNSAIGLVMLAAFSAITGVSLGPVMNMYLDMKNGAQMVGTAAFLTAGATFGCALYAKTTRKDFSKWAGFLFAGLVVLLLASIVSIFFPMPALVLTISVVGAALFTAYLLFDISRVVNGQETSYISAALSVYLDMLNLFLSLLRIFGILGQDD